jgi:hypothetical protein
VRHAPDGVQQVRLDDVNVSGQDVDGRVEHLAERTDLRVPVKHLEQALQISWCRRLGAGVTSSCLPHGAILPFDPGCVATARRRTRVVLLAPHWRRLRQHSLSSGQGGRLSCSDANHRPIRIPPETHAPRQERGRNFTLPRRTMLQEPRSPSFSPPRVLRLALAVRGAPAALPVDGQSFAQNLSSSSDGLY